MKSTLEMCRLCLQSFPRGRRVAITEKSFQTKLKTVFSFEVLPDDNFPIEACRGCLVTVDNFYVYCEKVRVNQERLHATATVDNDEDFPESVETVPMELQANDVELLGKSPDPDNREENYHLEMLQVEPVLLDFPSNIGQLDISDEDRPISEMEEIEFTEELKDDPFDEGLEDPTVSPGEPSSGSEKIVEIRRKTKRSKSARMEEDKQLREHFHLGCEMCPYVSETVPDLFQHYRREHQTKGYVRCCNRKFIRRARLLEHLGAHVGTIACDLCDKVYKSNFYLELHKIDRHGAPGSKPYKCDKCPLSFHRPYILRAHQLRHEHVSCSVCGKMLMGVQGLKSHMKKMHGEDSKRICPTCGKEFRCEVAMNRHLEAHKGIVTVEKVQCDRCDRWFDGKYNLRRHIRFIHDEEGPLECGICKHVSPNRRALVHHTQRVHRQKETYKCEYCGKERNSKLGLREHMATHTKIPLYSCEFCNLTFNSNANKYSHRKSKHPKEWEDQKQRKLLEKKGAVPISN